MYENLILTLLKAFQKPPWFGPKRLANIDERLFYAL